MDNVKEVIETIDIASESTSTGVEEVIDIEDEKPLSENEKFLRTKIEYSKALTELLKTLTGDGSFECHGNQFIRDILEELMKLILDIEKQLLVEF